MLSDPKFSGFSVHSTQLLELRRHGFGSRRDSQGAWDGLAGRQEGRPVEISFDASASVKVVSSNVELIANSEFIPIGFTILDNSNEKLRNFMGAC